MAGSIVQDAQVNRRSIMWVLADHRERSNPKVLSTRLADAASIAGKDVPEAMAQAFGRDYNIGLRRYDGGSESGVTGTEITEISPKEGGGDRDFRALRKDDEKKEGIQIYFGVVDAKSGRLIEGGLPSYTDEKTGKKEYMKTEEMSFRDVDRLMESLPLGAILAVFVKLDKDETSDPAIRETSGLAGDKARRGREGGGPEVPECLACGGTAGGAVDLPDTSVKLRERDEPEEGERKFSIMKMELYKGEKDHPVDLASVLRGMAGSAQRLDGSPVTLSDLQCVLFIVPRGEAPAFDAARRVDTVRFSGDVNVSLLEVVGRQQMERQESGGNVAEGPFHMPAPTQESAPAITGHGTPGTGHGMRTPKMPKMEESMLMRLLMNPVERRLWGRLFGLPDEEDATAMPPIQTSPARHRTRETGNPKQGTQHEAQETQCGRQAGLAFTHFGPDSAAGRRPADEAIPRERGRGKARAGDVKVVGGSSVRANVAAAAKSASNSRKPHGARKTGAKAQKRREERRERPPAERKEPGRKQPSRSAATREKPAEKAPAGKKTAKKGLKEGTKAAERKRETAKAKAKESARTSAPEPKPEKKKEKKVEKAATTAKKEKEAKARAPEQKPGRKKEAKRPAQKPNAKKEKEGEEPARKRKEETVIFRIDIPIRPQMPKIAKPEGPVAQKRKPKPRAARERAPEATFGSPYSIGTPARAHGGMNAYFLGHAIGLFGEGKKGKKRRKGARK